MQRYFYRRGEKVPVTEVQGVRAVQLNPASRSAGIVEKIGKSVNICIGNGFKADAPREEVAGLTSAGWVFVQPFNAADSRRAQLDPPAETQEAEPVFQQQDGHILIGNRRLVV